MPSATPPPPLRSWPPSKERRRTELSRFHEIGERSESMTGKAAQGQQCQTVNSIAALEGDVVCTSPLYQDMGCCDWTAT